MTVKIIVPVLRIVNDQGWGLGEYPVLVVLLLVAGVGISKILHYQGVTLKMR